jgi:hypothetical protein
VPYALSTYYFSGRLFAGNQMGLTPGYFTTADREAAMRHALEAHPPRMVIDAPDFSFDELPERNPRHFSPGVIDFITTHYHPLRSFGTFILLEENPETAPGVL